MTATTRPPSPESVPAPGRDRLAALLAGSREAAEQLMEETYRHTYRVLLRLCGGDRELAADLTQETYRRAWTALDGFHGASRFSTWLYRITYTTFLNHLRRPRRLTPLDEAAAAVLEDPSPGQERRLSERRSAARLRRAVLALPEDLRFTVTARFWGELPVREIAGQVGISTVAVRKRLRKAYRLLADRLNDPDLTDLETGLEGGAR